MYECDLHTHTITSDGNDTYQELIDKASEKGIKVIAVTDHDIPCASSIVVNGRVMDITSYAHQKNVYLLRSIEFSCDTDIEDVHIVALGCNLNDPFFESEYKKSIQSKIDGYKQLCEILSEDGLHIDWQADVLLDGQRNEESVQRKMIFEKMAEKGFTKTWSEAKLLVKQTPKYEVKRIKPDPVSIIKGIHNSGGIAILAHPFLITINSDDSLRDRYIDNLFAHGLDGIEACYPYGKTSYNGNMSSNEIESYIRSKYAAHVISGGSDYHNDGKKGVKNPRELGECGITFEEFCSQSKLKSLL